ncbi:MAG: T9SS type A sorting domain-containing protein [Bacteroidota bacterium]
MKRKTLLLHFLLALLTIPAFGQGIIYGPTSVCLNQPYNYSMRILRTDICMVQISITGGTINGITNQNMHCAVLGTCPAPYYQNINMSNTIWTSSGTKKITVTFFRSNTNNCYSSGSLVQVGSPLVYNVYNSPTGGNISGPSSVSGSTAYFNIPGSYTNHSWSVVPNGSGINVYNYGNNCTLTNVNNSPYSWHMISFQGTNSCGTTHYASKSFYKTSGGGGWKLGDELIEIDIFPNPATDKLTIQLPDYDNEVRVMDLSGREMIRRQGSGEMHLDIASLAVGTYFISVRDLSGKIPPMNSKFIKQ